MIRVRRSAQLTVPAMAIALQAAGGAVGVGGGKTISIRAAPWSVVIRQDGAMICTGVIAAARYVVTSGHCVYNESAARPYSASQFTIKLQST